MTESPLSQWLERLEQLHPREIDLGLDRVRSVADRMGLLPLPAPTVIVAGTNGKGTTVAALEALALAAGHRTGSCTSPHLFRFNERICVSGEAVADADIVSAFEAIEECRGGTSLTYFEFGILAALSIFRSAQVTLYLLEVGLGGRLDAVNIVDAEVAVITSIALDHEDWLGSDRGQIGVEKAGVARAGQPIVVAEPDPPPAMISALDDARAMPVFLGSDFHWKSSPGPFWEARLAGGQHYPELPVTSLHPGNLTAALQALALLDIPVGQEVARNVLGELQLAGRRQQTVISGRTYVLDVAHNLAALEVLLDGLGPIEGKTMALFGVMSDKDVRAMIALARGRFDSWFLADIPTVERAASAGELAEILRQAGVDKVSISENPRQALSLAQSVMYEGDRLVVFGSFHTVAQVLPQLGKDSDKAT